MTRMSILIASFVVVFGSTSSTVAQESPREVQAARGCSGPSLGQFPSDSPVSGAGQPCPDIFPSSASVQLTFTGGDTIWLRDIVDPVTVVGRSSPASFEGTWPICAAGAPVFPATQPSVGECFLRPDYWPPRPCNLRWEVHTEILSMQLYGTTAFGDVWLRAGQPFASSVGFLGSPPTGSTPQARYFWNSVGEVRSLYDGGPAEPAQTPPPPGCCDVEDRSSDFPADALFNIFVEVDIQNRGKFYNKTPMLVTQRSIGGFPGTRRSGSPFPPGMYQHSGYGATPMFDENGLFIGSLKQAFHGGGGAGSYDPPFGKQQPRGKGPVAFTVDNLSLGLDPVGVTMAPPNDVFSDAGSVELPLTVYVSSAAMPNEPPDLTNRRDPPLVGAVGGPGEFAPGDNIVGFTFGRDGTVDPDTVTIDITTDICTFDACGVDDDEPTLYFSVTRESKGVPCSDLWYSATHPLEYNEQAADILAVGTRTFGKHVARFPGLRSPDNHNIMAVDNTALGLRLTVTAAAGGQDNVTGVELDDFRTLDLWYGTFEGPSFPSAATIYLYDPAGGPFTPDSLTVFATPDDLGLQPGDVIDALAISDIWPKTTHIVKVRNTEFDPQALKVRAGDTIRWEWENGTHTVTSGLPCTADGRFNEPITSSAIVYEYTVPIRETASSIPYFCTPHCGAGLTGLITVLPGCPEVPNGVLNPYTIVNPPPIYDEILFSLAGGSPSLLGPDGQPGLAGVDDNGDGATDDPPETGLGDDTGSPAAIFYSRFEGISVLGTPFLTPDELGLVQNDDVDALDIQCPDAYPDLCDDASVFDQSQPSPWAESGSTFAGVVDAGFPTCNGVPIDQPGVWHSVRGTGNVLKATTCGSVRADYDTRLSVYCGDCNNPVCVTANDDRPGPVDAACDPLGLGVNTGSDVEWCSQSGVEYLILVHGSALRAADRARGRFDLTVSEKRVCIGGANDGMDCIVSFQCPGGTCEMASCASTTCGDPTGGCCLPSGGCTSFSGLECVMAGGVYRGDERFCGGDNDNDGTDDLCEMDNCPPARCGWQLWPATGPGGQIAHAMAYDALNRLVVMYAGTGSGGNPMTWVWDGAVQQWTQRFPPAPVPSLRFDHAMAYDAARGQIVLFGGQYTAPVFGDTWLWDGSTWTQAFPATTPPARMAHMMAYDAARGVVVMFGGIGANAVKFGDTWEWNGTNWVQLSPATSPSPRNSAAMAYDSARGVMVLYGGFPGTTETWEFDGTDWDRKSPANNPGSRNGHAMTFDEARGVSVVFGGNNHPVNLDTWEYDGVGWTRYVMNDPGPRSAFAMAYDVANAQTVLYGDSPSGPVGPDTWLYSGGRSVSQAYCALGTSSGAGWSWCVSGNGYSVCDPTTPGVPAGGSAATLASQFVQSVNATASAAGCTGASALEASVVPAAPECFLINACGGQAFDLGVGPFGQMPDCIVAPNNGCPFNPLLSMIPLSEEDCDGNGVDDRIDLNVGNLEDLDLDGTVDSCEPVRLLVARQGVDPTLLFASPTVVTAQPGDTLLLDVYVENTAVGLQNYQVTLDDATGGNNGSVTYQLGNTVINQTRSDWVHAGLSVVAPVVQGPPAQFGSAITVGVAPIVSLQPKYCGELTYEVSTDAYGTFSIDFVAPGTGAPAQTFLSDATGTRFDFVAESLTVEVDAPCFPSAPAQPETTLNVQGTLVTNIKNRMLSFTGGDPGRLQAVRVTFVDLPGAHTALNGTEMWVGEPVEYSEGGGRGFTDPCTPSSPCAAGSFLSSTLTQTPVFRDWSADPDFVHVRDEFVIPHAVYRLQFVDDSCVLTNPASFSPPLEIGNAKWGDAVELSAGDWRAAETICAGGTQQGQACIRDSDCPSSTCGIVSVFDTLAMIAKFSGAPGAPSKTRMDLLGVTVGPSPILDGKITVSDTVAVLSAFSGDGYPF